MLPLLFIKTEEREDKAAGDDKAAADSSIRTADGFTSQEKVS